MQSASTATSSSKTPAGSSSKGTGKATISPHSLAPQKPRKLPPLPKTSASNAKSNEKKKLIGKDTKPSKNESDEAIIPQDTKQQQPPQEPQEPTPLSTHLRKIHIRQLIETIEPILTHPIRPYTPLILDRSQRMDIFFQYSGDYSGVFIDAKKCIVETLVLKKVTLQETLEDMRQKLVLALKYGRTLVIRMGDTAMDLKTRFTHPDYFPSDLILKEAGRAMLLEPNYSRVVRDADKDQNIFVAMPDFKVIVTSEFELQDFDEFLADAFPFGLNEEMIPIWIEPPTNRNDDNDGIGNGGHGQLPAGYDI